ncbi:hypothetical protein CIG19_02180 [Enterobacterales bacterium CwR94]|nr:hypothetical protein CIG19_02180 [Enterobacterales bacterium CwR94]
MELIQIEELIVEWYKNRWNGRAFFSKKAWPVSLDTSLSTGNHPWAVETGEEIMNDYFLRFNVFPLHFDLLKYWPVEPGWIPNIFLPKFMQVRYVEPQKLTLRMLAESAKAGRWLYD